MHQAPGEEARREQDPVMLQLRYLDAERAANRESMQVAQKDKVWANQIAGQEQVARRRFGVAAQGLREEAETLREQPAASVDEELQKADQMLATTEERDKLVDADQRASHNLRKADQDADMMVAQQNQAAEMDQELAQRLEDAKHDLLLKLKRRNVVPGLPAINMYLTRITTEAGCEAEFNTEWHDGACWVAGEPTGPQTPQEARQAHVVEDAAQAHDAKVDVVSEAQHANDSAAEVVRRAKADERALRAAPHDLEAVRKVTMHRSEANKLQRKAQHTLSDAKAEEVGAKEDLSGALKKLKAIQERQVEVDRSAVHRSTLQADKHDAQIHAAEAQMANAEGHEGKLLQQQASQLRVFASKEKADDPLRDQEEHLADSLRAQGRGAEEESAARREGDAERAVEAHIRQKEESMREQRGEEEAVRMAAAKGRAAQLLHKDQERKAFERGMAQADGAFSAAAEEERSASAGKLDAMEAGTKAERRMVKEQLEAAETQNRLDALGAAEHAVKRSELGFDTATVTVAAAMSQRHLHKRRTAMPQAHWRILWHGFL